MRNITPELTQTLKCCCECPMLLPYETFIFGKSICYTLLCSFCRRKVRARTKEKLIIKWNRGLK